MRRLDGPTERSAVGREIVRGLIAAVPVILVAALGSAVTLPNIPTWYVGLAKPPFTPPNWLFGPAWTLLYAMMAVACWRLLAKAEPGPARRRALGAYGLQLGLNAAWSVAFFGLRNPTLGALVILALVAAIVWTIRCAWPLDRISGWLLVPYLAWVLFATYLNLSIWMLNG